MKKMKKTLSIVILSLALLVPTAVAQAAPAVKTAVGAEGMSSGLHYVGVVSRVMHLTVPNSSCSSEVWIEYETGRKNHDDYVLQAAMFILVASSNHSIFCGEMQAAGFDRLLHNCHNFKGGVDLGVVQVSFFSAYHCTDTEYNLYGPVYYEADSCPNIDGFYGDNYVDNDVDQLNTAFFYC